MAKRTTLLIDADILFHKFAYGNEIINDWDPNNITVEVDYDKAIGEFDWFVKYLMRSTGTRQALLCVSHPQNFRYIVMPTYKFNREDKPTPKLHGMLKEYALNHPVYESRMYRGLEADDIMGILATEEPGRFIIATLDKDLRQIPGKHFNWNKDKWVREISEVEGDLFFYQQILQGDMTDGYGGCPQIGPTKALDIVESIPKQGTPGWHREMWRVIVEEYKACEWVFAYESYLSRELNETHALINARVARMLRHGEYNFTKKEVNLWTPGKGKLNENTNSM